MHHKVSLTQITNDDMTPPPAEVTDNVIITENTKTDHVFLTIKSKTDKKFNCIICDKSFSSKHNLKVQDKRF